MFLGLNGEYNHINNMKSLPILLLICLVTSLTVLSSLAYQHYQVLQKNTKITSELQKAQLDIGRAETRYGDLEKEKSQLDEAIAQEIDKYNASLSMVAKLEAELKIKASGTGKVEVVYIHDAPLSLDNSPQLKLGAIYQATSTKELISISTFKLKFQDRRLKISADITSTNQLDQPLLASTVSYELLSSIKGTLIQATTEDGIAAHYLVLQEVAEDGTVMRKLRLNSFDVTIMDERERRIHLWDPYIDLGVYAGVTLPLTLTTSASLGVSTSSYGKTNDPIFRFARFSLEISNIVGFGFAPVLYNIGQPLVLFRNIWIGPEVFYRLDHIVGAGLYLGATL